MPGCIPRRKGMIIKLNASKGELQGSVLSVATRTTVLRTMMRSVGGGGIDRNRRGPRGVPGVELCAIRASPFLFAQLVLKETPRAAAKRQERPLGGHALPHARQMRGSA